GAEAHLLLGRAVPGGAIAFESPRPTVVIEAALAARSEREIRFLLGRALEPLRGGYSVALRLRAAERAELAHLLEQLLRPDRERDPRTQDFVRNLPRKAQRAIEHLVGATPEGSIDAWFLALTAASDRAGLLACDDVAAAAGM